MRAEQLA